MPTNSSGGCWTGVKARGWLDRAIVAVVSDHGEGLGDHGESEHGILLYRESLRVPWILRLRTSRCRSPHRRHAGARRCRGDTARSRGHRRGRARRPSVRRGAAGRTRGRSSGAETPRLHLGWSDLAPRRNRNSGTSGADSGAVRSLERPGERRNLAASRAGTATRSGMDRARDRRIETSGSRAGAGGRPRALERVGLCRVVRCAGRCTNATLPDPKDRIASFEALKQALAIERAGRAAEAIPLYRDILASNPRMVDAWESLARALATTGRMNEATRRSEKRSRSTRSSPNRTSRSPESSPSSGSRRWRGSTPSSAAGATRGRATKFSPH